MVSAFQDEVQGFGYLTNSAELAAVNRVWAQQGHTCLNNTPGLRFLAYGKVRGGWRDGDMFCQQVEDMIDWFAVLYPNGQLILEVDHSSGHGKKRENGLHAVSLNVKWGGERGQKMRDTVVSADSLGPMQASIMWQGQLYDCKLQAGDTQHSCFQPGSLPPFYDAGACPND